MTSCKLKIRVNQGYCGSGEIIFSFQFFISLTLLIKCVSEEESICKQTGEVVLIETMSEVGGS